MSGDDGFTGVDVQAWLDEHELADPWEGCTHDPYADADYDYAPAGREEGEKAAPPPPRLKVVEADPAPLGDSEPEDAPDAQMERLAGLVRAAAAAGDADPEDPVEADPLAPVDGEKPTAAEIDWLFADGNMRLIREAAEQHLIAPMTLLLMVCAHLSLRVPVGAGKAGLLDTPRLDAKPLSLYVMATGGSGTGKSDAARWAAKLLPYSPGFETKQIQPASGEALIEAFGAAEEIDTGVAADDPRHDLAAEAPEREKARRDAERAAENADGRLAVAEAAYRQAARALDAAEEESAEAADPADGEPEKGGVTAADVRTLERAAAAAERAAAKAHDAAKAKAAKARHDKTAAKGQPNDKSLARRARDAEAAAGSQRAEAGELGRQAKLKRTAANKAAKNQIAEPEKKPARRGDPLGALRREAERLEAARNKAQAKADELETLAKQKRRAHEEAVEAAETLADLAGKLGEARVVLRHPRCLLFADEMMGQLRSWDRQGTTTQTVLRTAWNSGTIGAEVTAVKGNKPRLIVKSMSYRLAAIAAGTWEAAGMLADMKEGGDAARWIFVCSENPDQPSVDLRDPGDPRPLNIPDWPSGAVLNEQSIDPQIVEEVIRALEAGLRAEREEAHENHGMQRKMRVAASLGWLQGHPGEMDSDDWQLAEIVMKHDRWCRAESLRRAALVRTEKSRDQGRLDGERQKTRAKTETDRLTVLVDAMAKTAINALCDTPGMDMETAVKKAVTGRRMSEAKRQYEQLKRNYTPADLMSSVQARAEERLENQAAGESAGTLNAGAGES